MDMVDLLDTQVFAVVGEEGFAKLVRAFYSRVEGDDILRPMYPQQDLVGAQERLREFLVQRFGGPDRYSRRRGHPALRMRHAPFQIDQKAKDRWLELMEQALEEACLPSAAAGPLRKFFHEGASFLMNSGG